MPYTHGLVGGLFWAGAAYALFRWVIVKQQRVALVVALAVFFTLGTRLIGAYTGSAPLE